MFPGSDRPNFGRGGERMTVGFEAGGKNEIAGKRAERFDENRARVLTTGATAMFQQGFRGVENDDFERIEKALVALASEPEGATEEIRKREEEALAKIGEMFPELPKATARVVESRYGDERYFVATRIDKAIEALKSGGDGASSHVSLPLSAQADPTSHALNKIDVSPAYGVWAMFGSEKEIGMRTRRGDRRRPSSGFLLSLTTRLTACSRSSRRTVRTTRSSAKTRWKRSTSGTSTIGAKRCIP